MSADHSSPYAAFQSRGFRYYIAGNFISTLGSRMLGLAIGWEIYRRTHSSLALGMIGLAGFIPLALFSIPAGTMADRLPRRMIVMLGQLFGACCSAALAYVSYTQADVRWMYALIFLTATARSFWWAARGAFMMNLVPQEHFGNAVTWNSSTFETASVVGPALGGLLLVYHPFWMIYALDAASSLVFFLMLLPTPRIAHQAPRSAGFAGLFDGLRFVFRTKIVLATITLDLFAVLFGGATALLPIYADQILHVGSAGLGWLMAAPSIGAICMGMTLAHGRPMRKPGIALLYAVTGFGLVTIVFGLSHSYLLSLAMLFLSGSCDNVSVVVRHTLVQILTPDSMRGRVGAVNNVFIGSSNELGVFESGVTSQWFGPIVSVVAGGIATILTVVLVALTWKEVPKIGPFHSMQPMQDEEPPMPL